MVSKNKNRRHPEVPTKRKNPLVKETKHASWEELNLEEMKAVVGPALRARAKADAVEAIRASKELIRTPVEGGMLIVIKGPPPFPVWADGDLPGEKPPLPPSKLPHYYMLAWHGAAGAEWPDEVNEHVLMRGEMESGRRMQTWCVRERALAEQIIEAAFGKSVKLPAEEVAS